MTQTVCNSLSDNGQADFEGDGFFVKPNDGVLVRGTNKGNIYEVAINPKVSQIFDIYSKTIGNPPPTHYLSFDTEKAELYVNGKILAQSLYLGEIDNGNIIDYVNDIGKKAIGGEYIDAKGIKVKKGNTVTFQVDEDGNVTARNAHFNGSVFVNGDIEGTNIKASNIEGSNIEGSVIKGAKIFAGDDYTEQDIIDAPIGTIKGATIDGSKIYATTIYGTSKEIKDNLALNSKVVYPEISGKSYKLMSGKNQKFGLTLGEDENQTVYMNLGQGTGGEVKVNDMVYGEDSLMIQKEADVAKIYIVGKDCSVELYENNEVYIKGSKIFANEWEIIPELNALQERCSALETTCNRLQNKIEALESRPSA